MIGHASAAYAIRYGPFVLETKTGKSQIRLRGRPSSVGGLTTRPLARSKAPTSFATAWSPLRHSLEFIEIGHHTIAGGLRAITPGRPRALRPAAPSCARCCPEPGQGQAPKARSFRPRPPPYFRQGKQANPPGFVLDHVHAIHGRWEFRVFLANSS